MRPLHKAFLSIAAIAILIAAFLLPRNASVRESVHAPPGRDAVAVSLPKVPTVQVTDAFASFADSLNALAARLGAEETMGAIGAELERVHSFVESQIPAVVVQPTSHEGAAGGGGIDYEGGGGHSDAWWGGVAQCEQGGNNHPYFGYLSFMDGSQGGKPWDEQVAAANDLIARYPGAWAQACVAAGYRASPNG